MNAGRHARRDPRLRASTECVECWSSVTKQGRCAPCRDYRSGKIDAEVWMRRVLRTKDMRFEIYTDFQAEEVGYHTAEVVEKAYMIRTLFQKPLNCAAGDHIEITDKARVIGPDGKVKDETDYTTTTEKTDHGQAGT